MAKELVYKVRIDFDSATARQLGVDVENSQERAEKAVNETTSAINRQSEAQENAGRSARSYQRNQSRANQVLFTYGDLLNDAQQFQFGFSNGLRAIGNNIGFAAEGIANLNTKAGGFTGTLKALGSSLLGPGGIILGLNLAVTAVTVFGDSLFGAGEKASEAEKDIKSLREEINRFSIQFDQLTQLQEEAFPDQDRIQRLRQQVQFSREIETTLSNRLDTANEEVKSLERQVDVISRLENKTLSVNDAIQQGLIRRETGIAIGQGRIDLEEQLISRQNKLERAKTEQASLEQSIQSAQEREINLLAKINELEAGRESATFRALQNYRKITAQQSDFVAQFQALNLNPEQIQQAFAIDPLGDERTISNQRVTLAQDTEQQITEIKRNEAQTRVNIEREAFSAISSVAQAIAPQNKALALSLIAIEKGLKIAQVIADGTQKAAAATSQGLLFLANPATAPLASEAFAAAAAIKTNTTAAVGLIAAQGLAEGAQAISAGNRGGGSGGGRANVSPARQGFFTSNIQRSSQAERDFTNQNFSSQPTIVVEANNTLPDTEFSVRAERGRKQRERRAVIVGSQRRS